MAKSIGELPVASKIQANDRFVLEQDDVAKSLYGQILLNWLTAAADGHGGIQSIKKTSTSGLVDTYTITLADTTTITYTVTNGNGISSISKISTGGLVDTYKITYTDGNSQTFTVTNGDKGDKGDRGEKGNTGEPATLENSVSEYLSSDSGTDIPSGSWSTTVPAVAQGKYLWTRVTQTFNTGDPVVFYSVARNGKDGSGSVVTVNSVSPDSNGNVQLTADSVGAVALDGSTPMTGALQMGGNKVTGLGAPTADADAATKSYADNMLPKAGGTMTGPISMGGNKVTGLGAPTADADAVNKGSLLNLIYPVGAIYISTAATSPATLFGGTWERLKDRFLLAAGDTYAAGATGGEAAVTLTGDQIAEHTHGIYIRSSSGSFASDEAIAESSYSWQSGGKAGIAWATRSNGGSAAHNNMPPYLAVYMWVRTA